MASGSVVARALLYTRAADLNGRHHDRSAVDYTCSIRRSDAEKNDGGGNATLYALCLMVCTVRSASILASREYRWIHAAVHN